MLSSEWRIQVVNNTGVALAAADTIEVAGEGWYFNSSGVLTYGADTVLLPSTSGNSLANGAVASGTAQTGNTFNGFQAVATASISTATPNGYLNFFLQLYDPTLGWPANGYGRLIGSMLCTVTGTQNAINLDF